MYRIYAVKIWQNTAVVVRVSRQPSVIHRLYAALICRDTSVIYVNSVGFVSRTAPYAAHTIRNAAVTVPLTSLKPYMGSIMPICFCCKSNLPVYLSCPSSTLSNIGLFPPPRVRSAFTPQQNQDLRDHFFFSRKEKKQKKHQSSLASAPSPMMNWSRRCSDLPKFCHPRVYFSPFLVIQGRWCPNSPPPLLLLQRIFRFSFTIKQGLCCSKL